MLGDSYRRLPRGCANNPLPQGEYEMDQLTVTGLDDELTTSLRRLAKRVGVVVA
jgi:hypothetical protein